MRVRFPGAERVTEIAASLLDEIKASVPEIKNHAIELSAFSKAQRTQFFQLLVQQLEGYKVRDVKKVNVNQEIYEPVFANDTDSDAESEQEELEQESLDVPGSITRREVEQEVKAYLKKASLDGSGILHASELKRFLESGFFISRIVWEAEPKSKRLGKPKAEVEALLERPAEGLGFKYTVRGVYPIRVRGTKKGFGVTKRKAKDGEREELLDVVEAAAQKAFAEIAQQISENLEGDQP